MTRPLKDLGRTDAYDYDLPERLIASQPCDDRAESRLLVLSGDGVAHRRFSQLGDLLEPGDVLVRNNARVLPARVHGRKGDTGGKVELLVLEPVDGTWQQPGPIVFRALAKTSKPLREGGIVELPGDCSVQVVGRDDQGRFTLQWPGAESLTDLLSRIGEMPIPPYIRRAREARCEAVTGSCDRDRYQTVYASSPGAVAAPTAGLHFTADLLDALGHMGVQQAEVTLDVGVGTFRPISAVRLDDHHMHSERYTVSGAAAETINRALDEGRRVIPVGTTSLRVLQDQGAMGSRVTPGSYQTDVFIRPGSPVHWISGLITNFHLPRSSLLTLVCAVGGYERVMTAYAEAIARDYRFYSFGDAMYVARLPEGPQR